MRPRARPATLACSLVFLLATAHAAAALQWYERYERGLQLEKKGAWGEAFEEFQAAAQVMPIPARRVLTYGRNFIFDYDPHYHMALCLVELGRPRLAAAQLRKSANARVTPPERVQELWRRIEGMAEERGTPSTRTARPTTGNLLVQSDPPGARILVDGIAQGTTPLGPLPLAAGLHVVRAEAPGFRAVEQRVTVTVGESATLVITLVASPPVPVAAASPVPLPTRQPALQTQPATPVPARAAESLLPAAVIAEPTAAFLQPVAPPPASPVAVRTIEIPEGMGFPKAPIGLAALVLLALTGALWLRGVRKRQALRPAQTSPTRVLEHATTLIETGAKLGGYELQSVLGRGGMATTYRARRTGDGQTVAVKVPHDGCLAEERFIARFLREGKLGEQLHHPNIVRIYAAGEEKGRPFLAMELVSGRTLKELLRQHGPLPPRRALEIARDIAEALDYAHAKGVIHRDLKPENVMVLPDGTLKVMDFGIARLSDQPGLTSSNLFLGTPLYAAPEMVDPKSIDHRVDLYALGIILYEMLEGVVPFNADSPYRVLEMHMRTPLPAREALPHPVPARMWAVVQRLCEKDPAARYPSAEVLLVEMNRLLQSFSELEAGDVF
ncbi:MAG: hypothetical protein A2Y78_15150 [Acidobacteria bacterium RBG_13_68_16]|nr:MAG: hypothetical protein A2Y78_15150 [Acidobacteria bacterium RBG_13_68_16]